MTEEERTIIIAHNAIFQKAVNSSLTSFTASNHNSNNEFKGFNLISKPTQMEGI